MSQGLMDPGSYTGKVTGVAVTTAKSGNDQMEIECQLLNDGKDTGVFVKVYLPLTESALGSWVDNKLDELGFNNDYTNPAFDATVYESVELYCKHDTYEQKTKEKWSIGGGPSNAPAPMDRLQRLNAARRARKGTSRPTGKAAVPARSAPPKSAPPPTEDETPTDVWTRDRAWDAWCATCEETKQGSQPDSAQWKKSIAERAADVKRKESAFTSDDWQHVAGQCPPF